MASPADSSKITSDNYKKIRKYIKNRIEGFKKRKKGIEEGKCDEEGGHSKMSLDLLISEFEKLREDINKSVTKAIREVEVVVGPAGESGSGDLLNLLYIGRLFDVDPRSYLTSTWARRVRERHGCLNACDDTLIDSNLTQIATLAGRLLTRPDDSNVSHKNTLEGCKELANLWLAKSDQIFQNPITYASLRGKLDKIMACNYFTAMPEIIHPVDATMEQGKPPFLYTVDGERNGFCYGKAWLSDDKTSEPIEVSLIRCKDKYQAVYSHNVAKKLRSHLILTSYYYDSCGFLIVDDFHETLANWTDRNVEEWKQELGREPTNNDKSGWWLHIQDQFKTLFRDVTEAIRYLYSEGFSHGNIGNYITVTNKTQARVLILSERDQSYMDGCKNDIESLKHAMGLVIGRPFLVVNVENDLAFNLPIELNYFFEILDDDNLTFVDPRYLFDTFYFWTRTEKVIYIEKLLDYCLMRDIREWNFNKCVVWGSNWLLTIPPDGRFREMLEKPQKDKQLNNSSRIVQPYEHKATHALRFFRNSFRHYNDPYKWDKSLYNLMLSREDVERQLSTYIPEFYVRLGDGLLKYARIPELRDNWVLVQEKLLSSFKH